MLFEEKLKLRLPDFNIANNTPYFKDDNGGVWDADIIIHDLKIAIHWNGAWHYKECGGKHSLKQVQSRDAIKHEAVEKAGYVNYVIKDLGKFKKEKVEEELERFLATLK